MDLGLLWLPIYGIVTFVVGICHEFCKLNSLLRWIIYLIVFAPILILSVGYTVDTWEEFALIPVDFAAIIGGALLATVPFWLGIQFGKPIYEIWQERADREKETFL